MATELSIISLDNQVIYSNAKKPLDLKLAPVATYADLATITRSHRYVGMTVTVLNEVYKYDEAKGKDVLVSSHPQDYWLVGSTANGSWKLKNNGIIDTYENLLKISVSACTLGLEMTVQHDYNMPDSGMSKYWVTKINPDNTVVWSRKIYGNELTATIEDTIDMLMNKKYGNVVYTSGVIYSYTDPDSGEITWTGNINDIPEGVEYETYDDGLYAIVEKDGETSFEQIVTSSDGTAPGYVTVDGTDNE